MSEHQFRNTMFGGFNRQDVLDYLTSSAEQTNQELQRRQETQEQLEKQLEQSREQCAKLDEQLGRTTREREELKHQAEQLTMELARVCTAEQTKTEQLAQVKEELAAAQTDLAALREQITRLAPDAEAYTAIKDRTAGVELEAHRRAQTVEARARIMAGDLQRQMEQWAARVEEQYTGLKGEIDHSVAQANEQMRSAAASLSRINQMLDQQQTALKDMVASYSETVRKKGE